MIQTDIINKKLAHDYELISTSYHEAGHTICGLICFMKIDNVRLIRAKRIEGETIYKNITDLTYLDDSRLETYAVRNEIYLAYAGLAAEKIYYKDVSGSSKFPIVLRDGSSLDIAEASDIIRKYNLSPAGKKRYSLKKRLFNEISELLTAHWDAIRAIAHALFKHKRLNFYKIKKILLKSSANHDFWKKQLSVITKLYRNKYLDERVVKDMIKL